MLDLTHIPTSQRGNTQVFTGTSNTYGETWQTWIKPRGKTMCSILLQGRGGNGGTSTPGLATAIAGAGGGSAGALVYQVMPLSVLPDILYLTLAGSSTNNAVSSCIAIAPSIIANDIIAMARGGNAGGNATSATAGTAGGATTVSAVADMPLGWPYTLAVLLGQAGSAGGGSQAAGGNVTLPVTGVIATGGTGGGGIDSAAGTSGYAGGNITVAAGADFPAHPGGAAATAAGTVPGKGIDGYQVPGKLFFYGGTGAGSSYNAATGAGIVQSPAGNGGYGSGGGGLAAAQNGSTAQSAALGGPALAIITCW